MTSPLRVSRTHFPLTALGYGRRLGLWVQGCPLACAGCVARDTWDPAGGQAVGPDELLARVGECIALGADGLTVSGGEPLEQSAAVRALLAGVRAETPAEFDILLYTGYELAELDQDQRAVLDLVDVVVTGRYVAAEPTRLIWRGSANQVMHLRTELARRRYSEFLAYEPEEPPMQFRVDDGVIWLAGVPAPGTLPALERMLRERGVGIDDVTWRPPRPRT